MSHTYPYCSDCLRYWYRQPPQGGSGYRLPDRSQGRGRCNQSKHI